MNHQSVRNRMRARVRWWQRLWVMGVVGLSFPLLGHGNPPSKTNKPTTQSPGRTPPKKRRTKKPNSRKPQVLFHAKTKRPLAVYVELACSWRERARGLMFRRKLGNDRGMLFVFPQEGIQRFWMKNTYIPLDMIHIDKAYKVVGIVENAKPHTTTSRYVGKKAKYVLEVNAFFARKHKIRPGQTVQFRNARCRPVW